MSGLIHCPHSHVPHDGGGTASLGFSRAMGRGQGKRAAEAGVCAYVCGGQEGGGETVLSEEKYVILRNLTGQLRK